MNFRDAASYVTDHPLTSLFAAWCVTIAGVMIKYHVLPRLQPQRPVKHGPEYIASKAKADASMARLGLGAPKEP